MSTEGSSDGCQFPGVKILATSEKSIYVLFPKNSSQPQWVSKKLIKSFSGEFEKGVTGDLEVIPWLLERWAEDGFDPHSGPPEDTVCIPGVVALRETDKGLQVKIGKESLWLPKSSVSDASEVKGDADSGTLVILKWVADKNNLKGITTDRPKTAQDTLYDEDPEA